MHFGGIGSCSPPPRRFGCTASVRVQKPKAEHRNAAHANTNTWVVPHKQQSHASFIHLGHHSAASAHHATHAGAWCVAAATTRPVYVFAEEVHSKYHLCCDTHQLVIVVLWQASFIKPVALRRWCGIAACGRPVSRRMRTKSTWFNLV